MVASWTAAVSSSGSSRGRKQRRLGATGCSGHALLVESCFLALLCVLHSCSLPAACCPDTPCRLACFPCTLPCLAAPAQRIEFARTKSDAVAKLDGSYKPDKERKKKGEAARGEQQQQHHPLVLGEGGATAAAGGTAAAAAGEEEGGRRG